jgi:mono/diheme cytochrome c family protein
MSVALTARAQSAPPPTAGAVHRGELLFSGQTRFARGGPACIACHSVGGLPFPNGGTLGPDLTQATTRMGNEGIQSALKTLYFPAMVPLYKIQPLTAEEQQDLAAFLRDAAATAPTGTTRQVAAIAGLIFLLLVLVTWRAGRGRLGGVRRRLIATARAAAAAPRPIEGDPP